MAEGKEPLCYGFSFMDPGRAQVRVGLCLVGHVLVVSFLLHRLQSQDFLPSLTKLIQLFLGSPQDNVNQLFEATRKLLKDWFPAELPPSSQDVSNQLAFTLELLLDTRIEFFGYAPCDVYSGILDFGAEMRRHNQDCFLLAGLQELARSLSKGGTTSFQVAATSHCLIAVYPLPVSDGVDWKLDFKSTWVAKSFLDSLESADDSEVR